MFSVRSTSLVRHKFFFFFYRPDTWPCMCSCAIITHSHFFILRKQGGLCTFHSDYSSKQHLSIQTGIFFCGAICQPCNRPAACPGRTLQHHLQLSGERAATIMGGWVDTLWDTTVYAADHVSQTQTLTVWNPRQQQVWNYLPNATAKHDNTRSMTPVSPGVCCSAFSCVTCPTVNLSSLLWEVVLV